LLLFADAYASLPLEIRDKLSKDLLSNPGKLGKDLLNMMGPQVQNLLNNFGGFNGGSGGKQKKRAGPESNEVEVEVEDMSMDYNKQGQHNKQKQGGAGGMDFGPVGSLLGNMISSNPQMLMNMVQGFVQGNGGGGNGFSFESITSMLTQNFDLDTVLSMASAFAGSGNKVPRDNSDPNRGEGGFQKQVWLDLSQ
jgi:hypothetical protein